MTATHKKRLDRLELETEFREWLSRERLLESFSKEQLNDFLYHGRSPDPLPDRLLEGASRLDGMTRNQLFALWKEERRPFAGRDVQELIFFTFHGHWPEKACEEENCGQDKSDQIA